MKCRSCKTELVVESGEAAIRCYQCQGWQNWRRHFDLSSLVLGALISIITIASIFFKPVYELVKNKSPDLNIAVLTSDTEEMRIMLSNSGESAAGIKEAFIQVEYADGMYVPAGKDLWGSILKGNESKSLTLKKGFYMLPVLADEEHLGYSKDLEIACIVTVKYLEPNNREVKKLVEKYICYSGSPTHNMIENKKYIN